jgi:hypothetical protein
MILVAVPVTLADLLATCISSSSDSQILYRENATDPIVVFADDLPASRQRY